MMVYDTCFYIICFPEKADLLRRGIYLTNLFNYAMGLDNISIIGNERIYNLFILCDVIEQLK